MPAGRPVAHLPVAILGLVTIGAYGSWYYAFGVLIDPIIADTGWSETALANSFSVGVLLIGLGSIVGGRVQDQLGTRVIFLVAGLGGGAAFLVAAGATDVVVFSVAAAIGLGLFGALGFYHVTMTAAVHVNPLAPGRAIAVLTIWGAFASVIYLPATAVLVEHLEWRDTVRVLAVSATLAFVAGALVVPTGPAAPGSPSPPLTAVAARVVRPGRARRFTAAVCLTGFAVSVLLVYQVPVMTAAGLPLGVAATVAALRGMSQLGGRLPLSAILARVGARAALVLALGAIAAGSVMLPLAGTVPVAVLFAVVAGFGIGAYSPLQGINAEELFDRASLGTTMGLLTTAHMLAGAAGPSAAGYLADWTDDRRTTALLAAASALVAALLIAGRRPQSELQVDRERADGRV